MRVHWSEGKQDDDLLYVTLCGRLMGEVAARPDEVTCRICARRLEGFVSDKQDAAAYVDAVFQPRPLTEYAHRQFKDPQPLVDPLSELPVVNRFTWNTVRQSSSSFMPHARRHWCGHCPVCVWFAELEADAHARPWRKTHRPDREFRWPSASAALRWYAEIRMTGYALGTLGESLERIGRLGTLVHGGSPASPLAYRQASDVVAVERALARAYPPGPSRSGMSLKDRVWVLLQVVGHDKPAKSVVKAAKTRSTAAHLTVGRLASIVSVGRQGVARALREWGLVPPR